MREQKEIKELKRYVLLANNEFIDTQRRIYKPELYIEDDVPYLVYYKRYDIRGGYTNSKLAEMTELSFYSTYKITDTSDDPKDLLREGDYISVEGERDRDLCKVFNSFYYGLCAVDYYDNYHKLQSIKIQTIYKWAGNYLVPVWSCEGLNAWVYQDRVKKEY